MPKTPRPTPAPRPGAVEVIRGEMLCAVRFWTEEQWAALPESERPRDAAHKPGVGWVGAVPVAGLH
ncbi:MAG TPA: hypothetical protein VGH33_04680 [Isosphaeraceae bacterium]